MSEHMDVQRECIDLPGEEVRCFVSKSQIEIVLRKHRDIIFDLHLGAGKTYTVTGTGDFYNARDKLIVLSKRHESVTFKDGERMHLWVGRNFSGKLTLTESDKKIMVIEPNKLDKHQHSDDPKEKPAPIIIALGDKPASTASINSGTKTTTTATPVTNLHPVTAAANIDHSVIAVVEGAIKGMPENIAHYFKTGGDKGTGLSDIDPYDVSTRNWIWGQVVGSVAYVGDNWSWLRDSFDKRTSAGFKLVKAKVHYVNGKVRFYFSGYSKFNETFKQGGHGSSHERVLSIFAGAGSTESSFMATAKGIAGSFKGAAGVSFIFGSVTAYAEWKNDIKKDGYDLAANLLMTLLKTVLVAAMVALFIAAALAIFMVAAASAVVVVAVGIFTLLSGLAFNYIVEATDKSLGKTITHDKSNTDGMASVIAPYMREAGHWIDGSWQHLMQKFPKDYKAIAF